MGRVVTDGTSASEAEVFNQFIAADGGLGVVLLAYRIYYDGAAWQVAEVGTITSTATVEAGLSWNATLDELDIDLSGLTRNFSFACVPVVSPTAPSSASGAACNYFVAARTSSADDIHIRFYDDSDAATHEHITTESAQMDFSIIMVGMET